MIRWLGLLSLAAIVVLVALLGTRTQSGEISGTISELPTRVVSPIFPKPFEERAVTLTSPTLKPSTNEEFDRLVSSGLSMYGTGTIRGNRPVAWFWEVGIPD